MSTATPIETHYREIQGQQREVDRLARLLEEAKQEAKEAREEYQDAVDGLVRLIREGPNPQLSLPFEDSEEDAPDPPAEAQPDQAGWQSVRLEDLAEAGLRLSERQLKAFHEANLETLGALAAWSKSYPLVTVPGIGPTSAAEVRACLSLYWQAHPEYTDPPEID